MTARDVATVEEASLAWSHVIADSASTALYPRSLATVHRPNAQGKHVTCRTIKGRPFQRGAQLRESRARSDLASALGAPTMGG